MLNTLQGQVCLNYVNFYRKKEKHVLYNLGKYIVEAMTLRKKQIVIFIIIR